MFICLLDAFVKALELVDCVILKVSLRTKRGRLTEKRPKRNECFFS